MFNKKTVAVFLSIIMVFAIVPFTVMAEKSATITAGNSTVQIGETSVSVDIVISDNTGMSMLGFEVEYDSSNFTLESYTEHEEVFPASIFGPNVEQVPFEYTATNFKENVTSNGKLITLNFSIKENCPVGTYAIEFKNPEAYTIYADYVDVTTVNGSIVVEAYNPFEFLGAQIRTSGVQGLRYIFEMDAEALELLSEEDYPKDYDDTGVGFGSVLVPESYLNGAKLTKETEGAVIVPAVKLYTEPTDVLRYTVCLIETPVESYNQEFVAVPYITYLEGGAEKTIYGEQTNNVTIFTIAGMMYEDTRVDLETKDYLYENILSKVDPNYER